MYTFGEDQDHLVRAGSTYDALSRWYDLISGPFERRPSEMGLTLLAPRVGEAILEIGCGTGHGLVWLSKHVGTNGVVHALDLSEGMLSVSQSRLDRHAGGNVWLCQGDATALPYQSECFDAVWMSFVLELMPVRQTSQVLAECARVLRAGGRLGVVSMAKRERLSVMDRLYAWSHRRWPRWIDCRPIDAAAILGAHGWHVCTSQTASLAGLGVDATIARRPD